MKQEDYLNTGMIEDYCLGMLSDEQKAEMETAMNLFPEVKKEVQLIQSSLGKYASETYHLLRPKKEIEIWETLDSLNAQEKMDLDSLPLINKYSDYKKWMEVVKPLLPDSIGDKKFLHILKETPEVTQMLVMSKTNYDNEIHHDLKECFLVLEGECCCDFEDGTQLRLSTGGFTDVPMHITHDLKILSPHFIGIIQRVAV